MSKILFIHPRKGLFQLTYCQVCGYVFECQNCTAKLTTYSSGASEAETVQTQDFESSSGTNFSNLESENIKDNLSKTAFLIHSEPCQKDKNPTQTPKKGDHKTKTDHKHNHQKTLSLTCHQCQTYYKYPNICPSCKSEKIISKYSGIDDLQKMVEKFGSVCRLDHKKELQHSADFDLTTRIFDPSVDYIKYNYVVFIQAENLDANIDYLTQEEAVANMTKLISSLKPETKVILDTTHITDLINQLIGSQNLADFVAKSFQEELKNRDRFHFPPFENIILITSQENTLEKSQSKIQAAQNYLKQIQASFGEIRISSPYPARFLKRKGKYSHHITVKYPRNYEKFFTLKEYISFLIKNQHLQARINPRHLF